MYKVSEGYHCAVIIAGHVRPVYLREAPKQQAEISIHPFSVTIFTGGK